MIVVVEDKKRNEKIFFFCFCGRDKTFDNKFLPKITHPDKHYFVEKERRKKKIFFFDFLFF